MPNRLTSTAYLRRASGIARRPAGRSGAGYDIGTTNSPRQAMPQRASVRARTVGAYVPGLTEKAFDKYGFSAVTLVAEWARIAGPQLAGHTAPERLKWPRPVGKYATIEDGCEGRPGATLTLRVDPSRAFDVEYGRAQLIERINGYFGYRAVERIKIVQAPLDAAATGTNNTVAPLRPLAKPAPTAPAPKIGSDLSDPALRAALERLAASIDGT